MCPAPFGAGPLGPANNPYPVASVPCEYVDNKPEFDYVPHNVKGKDTYRGHLNRSLTSLDLLVLRG